MYIYVMAPEWRSEDNLYEYVCLSIMCDPGIEFRLPVLVVSAVTLRSHLTGPNHEGFFFIVVNCEKILRTEKILTSLVVTPSS